MKKFSKSLALILTLTIVAVAMSLSVFAANDGNLVAHGDATGADPSTFWNVSSWASADAQTTIGAGQGFDGSDCFVITVNEGAYVNVLSVPVENGKTYTVSFKFLLENVANSGAYVNASFDGANQVHCMPALYYPEHDLCIDYVTDLGDGWYQFSRQFEMTSDTFYLHWTMEIPNVLYFDDLSIVDVNFVPEQPEQPEDNNPETADMFSAVVAAVVVAGGTLIVTKKSKNK